MLQQVLEDEVTSWLGRGWNSRAEGGRAGLPPPLGEAVESVLEAPGVEAADPLDLGRARAV